MGAGTREGQCKGQKTQGNAPFEFVNVTRKGAVSRASAAASAAQGKGRSRERRDGRWNRGAGAFSVTRLSNPRGPRSGHHDYSHGDLIRTFSFSPFWVAKGLAERHKGCNTFFCIHAEVQKERTSSPYFATAVANHIHVTRLFNRLQRTESRIKFPWQCRRRSRR